MEIDGEPEEAVAAEGGHVGEKLSDVALGIPDTGVRVGPTLTGGGIDVIKRGLNETGVHEQALDVVVAPRAALVGGAAVDEEFFAFDGHGGGLGR